MTAYDAIIIGTGQAGSPLARRMAGEGMKVAIVERGRFGGTLHQHGLHTDKNNGRQCVCRARGPPRC